MAGPANLGRLLGVYAATLLVAWIFAEGIEGDANSIVGGVFIGLCVHAMLMVAQSGRAGHR